MPVATSLSRHSWPILAIMYRKLDSQTKMTAKANRRCAQCLKLLDGDGEKRESDHSNGPREQGKAIVMREICNVHRCASHLSDVVH